MTERSWRGRGVFDPEEEWRKVVVVAQVGWRCHRCGFVVWQPERPAGWCIQCVKASETTSTSKSVERQLKFF